VGLARSYCSHDTESQNHKNDEAYDNVEAIALEIKAQRCERYTRDRCCDEKDESELDDGIGPQAHRGSDYPGQSSQITSLQVKCRVSDGFGMMLYEKDDAGQQHDHGGRNYAGTQQITDDRFQFFVRQFRLQPSSKSIE